MLNVSTGVYWLPVVIFLAEVLVVTVGTLRIIFVARGHKLLAPCLGFIEILIWLFAIGQVMNNLHEPSCFVAFALGFTLGNFLGILVEKWLALGTLIVRIVTHRDATELVARLRAANFGVTCLDGHGARGPVHVILTVLKRKQLEGALALVQEHQPHAFYTVDEVQAAEGIFPSPSRPGLSPFSNGWFRRAKARLVTMRLKLLIRGHQAKAASR